MWRAGILVVAAAESGGRSSVTAGPASRAAGSIPRRQLERLHDLHDLALGDENLSLGDRDLPLCSEPAASSAHPSPDRADAPPLSTQRSANLRAAAGDRPASPRSPSARTTTVGAEPSSPPAATAESVAGEAAGASGSLSEWPPMACDAVRDVGETYDGRTASCGEYLEWRRQVNQLLPAALPTPLSGVPSCASFGLRGEAASAATAASEEGRLESEFNDGIASLQEEMDSLIQVVMMGDDG